MFCSILIFKAMRGRGGGKGAKSKTKVPMVKWRPTVKMDVGCAMYFEPRALLTRVRFSWLAPRGEECHGKGCVSCPQNYDIFRRRKGKFVP